MPSEVQRLRQLYDNLPTRGGESSAGSALGSSKRNAELELGDAEDEVRDLVVNALNRTEAVAMVLLPKFVSAPILSRYDVGMRYGTHTDSAFGQDRGTIFRTDFSCTIFLDDAADYLGGELSIETEAGVRDFRLDAGGAVFYPTLFDHQVKSVTQGTRRACVFWLESLVRDPQRRRVLVDLQQISEWIGERESMESEARRAIIRTRENLLRMWLEN